MKFPNSLVILFIVCLLFYPITAYAISPFSGLVLADSKEPPGARIFEVVAGSQSYNAGLQTGDIIVEIEGQAVNSLDDFIKISKGFEGKEGALISIKRGDKALNITVGKKPTAETASPEVKGTAEPPQKGEGAKTPETGSGVPNQ